jgi:hypothetical protein
MHRLQFGLGGIGGFGFFTSFGTVLSNLFQTLTFFKKVLKIPPSHIATNQAVTM